MIISELENSWIRDHQEDTILHIWLVIYNLESTFIIKAKQTQEQSRRNYYLSGNWGSERLHDQPTVESPLCSRGKLEFKSCD